MTKKEKVIKGLKCCIEDYSCISTEDHHPDCPYWEADDKEIITGCMRRLFDDAINVLESEADVYNEIIEIWKADQAENGCEECKIERGE